MPTSIPPAPPLSRTDRINALAAKLMGSMSPLQAVVEATRQVDDQARPGWAGKREPGTVARL